MAATSVIIENSQILTKLDILGVWRMASGNMESNIKKIIKMAANSVKYVVKDKATVDICYCWQWQF